MRRGVSLADLGIKVTIPALMILVALVGVGVAIYRAYWVEVPESWQNRLLQTHALIIAVVIPLIVAEIYFLTAAGEVESTRWSVRTGVAFAIGICLEVGAVSSLIFWVILMTFVE